jgi:hypothetical protein
MANDILSNSFTGKGIIAPLPSNEGVLKSQENMDNMLIGAQKLQYDTYKQNAEAFSKASNVPPEFVLADSAQKTQMGLINAFNQKWGKVFQQAGGNLSDEQKMQMTTDKNVLLMQQQQMKSSMEQALAAKDAIQKDVQGNLDHDDFNKRFFGDPDIKQPNGYLQTGVWDSSPLLPATKDPDEFFNNEQHQLKNGTDTDEFHTVTIGGVPQKYVTKANGTIQEGTDLATAYLHTDPGLARGVIKKFQALKETNPSLYNSLLDTNGDGKVDANEAQAANTVSNPIMKWYQDTYGPKTIKHGQTTPVNLGGNKGATKFDYTKTSATNNKNDSYATQEGFSAKDATGKVFSLPGYQDIGQTKATTVSQNIKQIYTKDTNGNEVLKPFNQSAKFDITGYSKDKDQLLITLDSETTGDGDYSKGDQLVVPASDFDDVLKNKYGIFRGQQTAPIAKKKAY